MKHKTTKVILTTATLAATTAIITSTAALKTTNHFKPSFFNYKAYMSEYNINQLSEAFDYKEFDEINQFSNALRNNKTVAGIGSEFLTVELIKNNLISKLDYSILFNLPELKIYTQYDSLKNQLLKLTQLKANKSNEVSDLQLTKVSTEFQKAAAARNEIRNYVKLTMRSEVWKHLAKYQIGNDNELWEYFYPYYSQDMAIAYNIHKIDITKLPKYKNNKAYEDFINDDESINFEKYFDKYRDNFIGGNSKSQQITNPYAIINVLKTLSANGFDKWLITDAVRDNMLYGSSYWPSGPNGQRTDTNFSGAVDLDESNKNNKTYKILIDAFADLIKDGTGYDVRNSQHITLKGDGLEIVNELINPKRPDVNAAIMYNGDVIDAYYAKDNFKTGVTDDEIRAVKPSQNILLVDGLVITSKLEESQRNYYLNIISQGHFSYLKDIITRYKNLKAQNLIPDLSNSVNNQIKLQKIQNIITEDYVMNVWKDLKKKEFSEYNQSHKNEIFGFNINDYQTFINDIAKIIDLSIPTNKQKFNEFYKTRNLYQNNLSNNENEDISQQRINYAPHLIEKYLRQNHALFIDNLLKLFKDNIKIKNEHVILNLTIENINNFLKEKTSSQFENILAWILSSNLQTLKDNYPDSVNELNNDENPLFSWLANSITYINLGNEDFLEDYPNLNNFAFINYTPSSITDYEIVFRYYFLDKFDGQDQTAINMYEIIDNSNTIHETIQPVDDKTLSLITTYYFNKVKS
ncbi:spermidine/putrescine transport system substrate-binding protein [Mycoplasmopsis mustelae]|uniref:Spermidine/putrescine transport system substrate-binding protein n=1 Tax=Mycoplasmopsis mustelae TaxID=171289 RepID=A0A4R7UEC6_9BACT|nr:hypothetical protein [Mycoplasmopsis mustelae]TDV23293.1 spermidine/putrescine transport system substrate-binding protein [Mycoplasmopsis mustelae]